MHNTNSQIKFKTSKLTSSLCHYSDAYIPVSGNIVVIIQKHLEVYGNSKDRNNF